MSKPVTTLLYTNLKSWLGTKGVWLVFGAAMIPFVLTTAWVVTHQGDIQTGEIAVGEPARVEANKVVVTAGDEVRLSSTFTNAGSSRVGAFNATLAVGLVRDQGGQRVFTPRDQQQVRIDGLDPGQSRTLELSWNATPSGFGQLWVLANADPADEVGETDEFNNQQLRPVVVRRAVPGPDEAPTTPTNLTGNASRNRTADVRVEMTRTPADPLAGDNVTVEATVTNDGPDDLVNASVSVEIGRTFQSRFIPAQDNSTTVSLAAGESTTITLEWPARAGSYWARATVNVSDEVHDPDGADNHVGEPFAVQSEEPDFEPPEAPDRLTLKQFYTDLMSVLHLRILIPFIALFYAGGVVTDEKSQGTLTYLLTRPIERWLFPVTKFASGYAVAALAVALGIVASFVTLFGNPGVDAGFLTSSLVIALVGLFVYGGFFVLLGTLVDRPYLVGIAFVIGWEAIAGSFVPWVENLTIHKYLADAIQRVDVEQGFLLADQSLGIVIAAGAVFLLLAGVVMKQREFDV